MRAVAIALCLVLNLLLLGSSVQAAAVNAPQRQPSRALQALPARVSSHRMAHSAASKDSSPSGGLNLQGGELSANGARSTALSGNGSVAIAGVDSLGKAYIYVRDSSGTWSQSQTLTIPNGSSQGFGYSVALNADGTVAIVGAPYATAGTTSGAGAAYVFVQTSPGSWSAPVQLEPTTPAAGANFGLSVSIDGAGDEALIGAPRQADSSASSAGGAYVFQESNASWQQTAALQPAQPTAGLIAGTSVGLSSDGTAALLGANGSAYVFNLANGAWSTGTTIANPGTGSGFGLYAVLSGDGLHALVDAAFANVGSTHGAGEVYAFADASGTWIESGSWTDPKPSTNEDFGSQGGAIALSGDGSSVLIGAKSSGSCGTLYLASYTNGAYSTPTATTPPSCSGTSYFGYTVALSEDGTTALAEADVPGGQGLFFYQVPIPTSIEVQPSPQTPTYGQMVTITATVSAGSQEPPGTVTFSSGTISLGQSTLSNGVAEITTTELPAGTDTITAVYTPVDSTYASSTNFALQSVNPAPLTLACDNATMAYGSSVPTLSWQATGFVNGDTSSVLTGSPTCTTSVTKTTVPGNYPIAINAPSVSASNYTITLEGATLTVSPATLTVQAASQSMTYGDPVPAVTYSYSGFVNGESATSPYLSGSPSCSTSATSTSPVNGVYSTACTAGSLQSPDGHYVFSFNPGIMTIKPKTLQVYAGSYTIAYGAAIPTITPTYKGLVSGDSGPTQAPTCGTSATGEDAGTFVTYCSGAYDSNYTPVYVNGLLTITPASSTTSMTLTGSATTTYGQPVQLDVTVSGAKGLPAPQGKVEILDGSTQIGSVTLNDGSCDIHNNKATRWRALSQCPVRASE